MEYIILSSEAQHVADSWPIPFKIGLLLGASLLLFLSPARAADLVDLKDSSAVEQEKLAEREEDKEIEAGLKKEERALLEAPEEAPEAVAPVAGAPPFFVEKILVTGNTVFSDAKIREITGPHEAQEMTLPEAKALARKITILYRSKGYVTSRAYIPPQKLEDKILEIKVLEGKLGNVKVEGNRFFRRQSIARFFRRDEGEVIRYSRLKQNVVKVNLNPDREVRAVIIPGEVIETSDLLLNVKDQFPIHFGGEINNFGTRLTGEKRYTVSVRDTNLLGLDDVLGGKFQFGEGLFAAGAQYVLPVGPYGTQLGGAFNYTSVEIGEEFKSLDIEGKAYAYSISVNQPLCENQYFNLILSETFESKTSRNTIADVVSSKDELRMFHTGLHMNFNDPFGRTVFTNNFTLGVEGFGASDEDGNLSRPGSDVGFFKYALTLTRFQPIYDSTYFYMKASAQITPQDLLPAEQYIIGGVHSVRGYPEGDFLGDHGAGGSVELRVPFYFIPREIKFPGTETPIWNRFNAVGFLDTAFARVGHPAEGQHGRRSFAGAGLGLRFDLPRNISGRFEWAFPFGDEPSDHSNNQFYFSLSLDFF